MVDENSVDTRNVTGYTNSVIVSFKHRGLKRFLLRTLPVSATLAVLFTSLVLVSDIQTDGTGYSRHYMWVLILTGLALLGLALFGFSKLEKDLRDFI